MKIPCHDDYMALIQVLNAILVSANEALVVYSGIENHKGGKLEHQMSDDQMYTNIQDLEHDKSYENKFERKVLYGPIRYVPKPGEWIHEFNWHGEDPTSKTRKIKGALQFKLLRIIADQMYYNIQE